MIQLINKLKKNQKGFTLVELIVVLVILAILAAFTIPAMLGFVNDARAKALVSQTREVYMAYQAALTDETNAEGIKSTLQFTASGSNFTPDPMKTGVTNKVQKGALNKLVGDLITETKDDKGSVTGYKVVGNIKYYVWIVNEKVDSIKLTDTNYTITIVPTKDGSGAGEATTEKGDTTGIS